MNRRDLLLSVGAAAIVPVAMLPQVTPMQAFVAIQPTMLPDEVLTATEVVARYNEMLFRSPPIFLFDWEEISRQFAHASGVPPHMLSNNGERS